MLGRVWESSESGSRQSLGVERVLESLESGVLESGLTLPDSPHERAGDAGRGRPGLARRSASRTRVVRTEDGTGQPGGRTRRRERQSTCFGKQIVRSTRGTSRTRLRRRIHTRRPCRSRWGCRSRLRRRSRRPSHPSRWAARSEDSTSNVRRGQRGERDSG